MADGAAENWTPDQVRGDESEGFRRAAWAKALARWRRAEAGVAALAQSEDEDAYDRAVGRQIAALGRVLRAPAPDGAAAAWKLELIAAHQAYELGCWDAAVAALAADVRRLAG